VDPATKGSCRASHGALVEGGDREAESPRPESLAGKRHPRLEIPEAVTVAGDIRPKSQTDDDVLLLAPELEEADELALGERREVPPFSVRLREQERQSPASAAQS
jgi:hypothetical protein